MGFSLIVSGAPSEARFCRYQEEVHSRMQSHWPLIQDEDLLFLHWQTRYSYTACRDCYRSALVGKYPVITVKRDKNKYNGKQCGKDIRYAEAVTKSRDEPQNKQNCKDNADDSYNRRKRIIKIPVPSFFQCECTHMTIICQEDMQIQSQKNSSEKRESHIPSVSGIFSCIAKN